MAGADTPEPTRMPPGYSVRTRPDVDVQRPDGDVEILRHYGTTCENVQTLHGMEGRGCAIVNKHDFWGEVNAIGGLPH